MIRALHVAGRDHRWTQRHLSDYLDRELRPGARRRLEAHAIGCPECRRALRTLAAIIGALRRLPPPRPPRWPLEDAVMRRVAEHAARSEASGDEQ